MKRPKVAIVHDWLDGYRGGERVLEAIANLYPDAPIFTLFYDPQNTPLFFRDRKVIYPPALNRWKRIRKNLLPILPYFIESFDLSGYDLVISSSSCVAKGIIPTPNATHICYAHSPMRYVWDQREEYWGEEKGLFLKIKKATLSLVAPLLRIWDVTSAARVDHFIANSDFVAKRLKKFYRRESVVIHPFFDKEDIDSHLPEGEIIKSDYLLVAGAWVPYKKSHYAVQTAIEMGRRVVVMCPEAPDDKITQHPLVSLIVNPPRKEFLEVMAKARCLLFPGTEDFGIVPLESVYCGTPVIAFADGGALETVQDQVSGLFFREHNEFKQRIQESLERAWDRTAMIKSVSRFSKERFLREIKEKIETSI